MSDGKALTPFEPSANQLAVLSAFQDADYGCRVSDACQVGGVTKQAYYLWHNDPAFSKWWAQQAERHFSLQLGRVYGAAIRAAEGEDLPGNSDRKLLLERFDRDYCPASRQHAELSGPGGGAIPIQVVMFGMPPDGAADETETNGDAAAGA